MKIDVNDSEVMCQYERPANSQDISLQLLGKCSRMCARRQPHLSIVMTKAADELSRLEIFNRAGEIMSGLSGASDKFVQNLQPKLQCQSTRLVAPAAEESVCNRTARFVPAVCLD
jgi:hypothetical protein